MAADLEQFVKQLEDSGVIAAGKLERFIPPTASPKDAKELARQLILSKQLTKFQVQEIYQGRAKSLILGNYTILDKIGAGGMGQVFKAEHRKMHRVVAIKMLPNNVTKDAAAISRFQREVEAAAKLSHRNIVAAYDANEADGIHFLAMEYVEGTDLSALVKKDGPLPVRKATDYIMQAARGLEFAHAEHVVHRDIKPANLLLDKKGTIKILDMGLARIESSIGAAAQAELTNTGAVLGTVDYMAPEQGLSTKKADARADIYSLGCTLFYLLIAKSIYDGESVMAKLLAHHQQPVPDLRKLNDDVPDQLQTVFSKMVAKKVEDRYQTMSEVIAALESPEPPIFGQQTFVGAQQSIDTTPVADALTFLNDIPLRTTIEPKPKTKPPTPPPIAEDEGGDNEKLFPRKTILRAAAAALLGAVVLAGLLIALRSMTGTRDVPRPGTLTVKLNPPDAAVQVLNEEGKVEISRPGVNGAVSVSLDPGKHRLRVEKNGFQTFTQDFAMESGGEQAIQATLEPVSTNSILDNRALKKWMKDVAFLTPEEQVQAVVRKLQERNPGFDGLQTHKIEDGVVREFRFVTDKVTDVSPVRALAGLERLSFNGSYVANEIKGMLSDLSPLEGMHLTHLDCGSTQVADLSPLKGMQLAMLACHFTPVSDLSPLQGMPLKALHCDFSKVTNLSPLKGMKLSILTLNHTLVSDLSPLKGMPLTRLECDVTQVAAADLAALQAILARERNSAFEDPPFKQWAKTVSALPAEKQVAAVVKKLREFNPDFDGNETHKIENGVVTELQFVSDYVTDISPVRALATLKVLNCGSAGHRYLLSDLSPLEGMQLTELDCGVNTQITNLSAIKGMPLTKLYCRSTAVADFSPLRGMPLTYLDCGATRIADLTALKGLPLKELNFDSTGVSDLSSLQGMPLTSVSFDNTNVTDLSPLRGKKISMLVCTRTQVSDLSPLKGMPLTSFNCESLKVSDLTPLKGMPLTYVDCNYTQISDLSPLHGMPLTNLYCGFTRVSDLSPLQGMRLVALSCYMTRVSDLSPLQGMPLQTLDFGSTRVFDISPLKGMPLTWLHCLQTQVSDLSPLRGAAISDFAFAPKRITKGLDAIRQMKSLTAVQTDDANRFPPDDFWEKYDRGEFLPWDKNPAFRKWLKDVAALPAEKQVAAVVKKLQAANPGYDGNETHKVENGVVTELTLTTGQIVDISPVRALVGLKLLCVRGTDILVGRLSDLSPLQGMPLTSLNVGNTNVFDLSPLQGMPLTFLDCRGTRASDLSPLRGMPLLRLLIDNTWVSDLSLLHGMPLTTLFCEKTLISDLSPLEGMKLSSIALTPKNITNGLGLIRQMNSLTSIGTEWNAQLPVADFWKKYDAGEFNK